VILETDRLILRPIEEFDAPALLPFVSDGDVAYNLLRMPHPYPEEQLVPFIRRCVAAMERREQFDMVVILKATGQAIGMCSLDDVLWQHMRAEIGYYLGKPYWGHGYMTEAAKRMLEFGFWELGLERIHAYCFVRNTASARILEKIGMTREGCCRRAIKKADGFLDVFIYGIIREEFAARP
jgi:[ribosomal protein S5]-alanine N-acetyltransferase